MKKIKIIVIFIVLALVVGFGILNYDKIRSYFDLPTRGLEYTLNDAGTSYSVSKGKIKDTEKLIIPSSYNDLPVETIANSAFKNCNSIVDVVIPDSITFIGSEAFLGCTNLKGLIIPNNVLEIGQGAFFGCSSLKPYSSPFSGSGIEGNNYIGYVFGATMPFNNGSYVPKSLEVIKITSDSKPIEQFAFAFLSGLKELSIIKTQKTISDSILHQCDNIEKISLPLVIPTLSYLFGGPVPDSLKNFNLTTSGEKTINGTFFKDCKGIVSINVPEEIVNIGDEAFKGCISLTYVFIPKSVFYIGDNAFDECPNVEINCEVLSKPMLWSSSWNPDDQPVVWGSISNK